ncbi:MAG: hypothetical protein M1825_003529 [Sarcosagium campestre]|nr:MAG: hypothetical protein M1825_003529 [Sarcosagium campestre]
MPSNRRLRTLMVIIVVLIFIILYLTSDARKAGSQDFYETTVQAMREKTDAENAKLGETLSDRLKEAENAVRKAAHLRSKDETVLSGAGTSGEGKGVAGRKKMGPSRPASDLKGSKIDKGKHTTDDVDKEAAAETEQDQDVKSELGSILKRSPIIIFSKTYCPHSMQAKELLVKKYKIVPAPFVVELDEHPLGARLQDALEQTTGRRTVPNILVSGRSIGGADEVTELEDKGELIDKVKKMAGKRIMEAALRKGDDL